MKSSSPEKKPLIWKQDTALELLFFFLDNPTKEFYEKQVAGETGLSAGAVNKYLKMIAEEGFLRLAKRGNMSFYSLERGNPVVRYLKIAYNLSKPVAIGLRNFAKKMGVKAYVYGSVARGEDTEESDWDVLVIGGMKLSEAEGELSVLRKKSGKKIRTMFLTQSEWTAMERKDKAFYERVEKDKIELI